MTTIQNNSKIENTKELKSKCEQIYSHYKNKEGYQRLTDNALRVIRKCNKVLQEAKKAKELSFKQRLNLTVFSAKVSTYYINPQYAPNK